jgi:hypothetical protein
MTPRRKGDKSEEKKIFFFYFNFNHKKTSNLKMKDELVKYGFRKFKENQGIYDLESRLSLELEYNGTKFASDLLKRYNQIKEIEVRTESI